MPDLQVYQIPTYDEVLAQNLSVLKQFVPDYEPIESDNIMLLLEAFSYRELMLRQQFNSQLKNQTVLYAGGGNLDTVAVGYGVTRLNSEADDKFRSRIIASLNRFSTAGSLESYQYHTRTADARVDDVKVLGLMGRVDIVITAFGEVTDNLLAKVWAYLNLDKIRPLGAEIKVLAAQNKIINLAISLIIYDSNQIDKIKQSIESNLSQLFTIGQNLPYSQLIDNLQTEGVYSAKCTNYQTDITCTDYEILKIGNIIIDFTVFTG